MPQARDLTDFESLPLELVSVVARSMGLGDLLRCRLVSTRCYQLWSSAFVLQTYCRQRYPELLESPDGPPDLDAMLRSCYQKYFQRQRRKLAEPSRVKWGLRLDDGKRARSLPATADLLSPFQRRYDISIHYGDGLLAWQGLHGANCIHVDDLRDRSHRTLTLVDPHPRMLTRCIVAVSKELVVLSGSFFEHDDVPTQYLHVVHLAHGADALIFLPLPLAICYAQGTVIAAATAQGPVLVWAWGGDSDSVKLLDYRSPSQESSPEPFLEEAPVPPLATNQASLVEPAEGAGFLIRAIDETGFGLDNARGVLFHPREHDVIFLVHSDHVIQRGPDGNRFDVIVRKFRDGRLVRRFERAVLFRDTHGDQRATDELLSPTANIFQHTDATGGRPCQRMNAYGMYRFLLLDQGPNRLRVGDIAGPSVPGDPYADGLWFAECFNVLTETFHRYEYESVASCFRSGITRLTSATTFDDELILQFTPMIDAPDGPHDLVHFRASKIDEFSIPLRVQNYWPPERRHKLIRRDTNGGFLFMDENFTVIPRYHDFKVFATDPNWDQDPMKPTTWTLDSKAWGFSREPYDHSDVDSFPE